MHNNNKGYTPNLTGVWKERNLHKIKSAYGWAKAVLDLKPREVSKTWIDENLGQQQNDMSKWLRRHLLECVDSHFSFGSSDASCKKYVLNQAGANHIKAVIQGAEPQPVPQTAIEKADEAADAVYDLQMVKYWVEHAYGEEIRTMDFKYKEKESARLWHDLQNLRGEHKKTYWESVGLKHNYDIKACAPTLISQHAQQLGQDEWMFGIDDYLKNTKEVRSYIAELVDIPVKDAKVLINALFCGARLGNNPDFALFGLLGEDKAKVNTLKLDARLCLLRDDIKKCWKAIETSMPEAVNENGRKIPLNSRRKWGRYFELERSVLNVIRAELNSRGIKCFLEHDGWRSDTEIDVEEMQKIVFEQTGFRVILSKD